MKTGCPYVPKQRFSWCAELLSETRRAYVRSVMFFLGLTLIFKIASLLRLSLKLASPTELMYFAHPAPFIPAMPNLWMVVFAAAFEATALVLLYAIKSMTKRLAWIAWIGGVFCLYHLGLRATDYSLPCPCLSGLVSWLGMPKEWTDGFLTILIVYFLLGSYWFLLATLFFRHRANRQDSPSG